MAGRQGLLVHNMGQKLRTVVDPGSVIGVHIGIGSFVHCLWVYILGLFIRSIDKTDGIMQVYPPRGWFEAIGSQFAWFQASIIALKSLGSFFQIFLGKKVLPRRGVDFCKTLWMDT